jgi:FtsH-binding integral membrane protein
MVFLISNEMITNIGMWLVVPVFIAFLFFIMWDISKKSHAGKAGTFWIFVALGGGFFGYLIKLVIQYIFEKNL